MISLKDRGWLVSSYLRSWLVNPISSHNFQKLVRPSRIDLCDGQRCTWYQSKRDQRGCGQWLSRATCAAEAATIDLEKDIHGPQFRNRVMAWCGFERHEAYQNV